MFQLNLDGQQITQKIAGSGFGQPRFSREAIAEFQIVTNLFDITQGRSAGMQVQAISKSGTNNTSGSVYGFFRDDKFNAPDTVAGRVLPYSNQQIGGTLGGPIIRDKMHYFASYEYEREPGTFFTQPLDTARAELHRAVQERAEEFSRARRRSVVARADRLSIRGSRWDWAIPSCLASTVIHRMRQCKPRRPPTSSARGRMPGRGGNKVARQSNLAGYNFDWNNSPLPEMVRYPNTDFPGSRSARPTTSRSTSSRTTSRAATT